MAGTTTILSVEITSPDDAARVLACVHQFGGRQAHSPEPARLALFGSAYDAARAAVSIQQTLAGDGADSGAGVGPSIGLNVGELDGTEDGVFRAAATVAHELGRAAVGGQILATPLVRMLVGERPDIEFVEVASVSSAVRGDPVEAVEIAWEPTERRAIRVVVADDAALIRSGVVHLLTSEGFDVIAEADDYDTLIAAVDRDPPDLVVTDIRMPPTQRDEGLRAAAHINAHHPDTAVLVLSQYIEAGAALDLLHTESAGVGYLLKERVGELDDFVAAARQVAAGANIIDPMVADQLISRRGGRDSLARLTDREREVLALMAQGLNNRSISDALHVSAKTVETYVSSIFAKLDLPGDSESNRRVRAVVQWLEQATP